MEVRNKSFETSHMGHYEVPFYQAQQNIPTGFTLLGVPTTFREVRTLSKIKKEQTV
ncbi:hypothetical protein [Bacillus mycoides]|uniref:hypothetical protein n=1 Tax=Bacillus mycoides TaxID=1405 RepID=UPI0036E8A91C